MRASQLALRFSGNNGAAQHPIPPATCLMGALGTSSRECLAKMGGGTIGREGTLARIHACSTTFAISALDRAPERSCAVTASTARSLDMYGWASPSSYQALARASICSVGRASGPTFISAEPLRRGPRHRSRCFRRQAKSSAGEESGPTSPPSGHPHASAMADTMSRQCSHHKGWHPRTDRIDWARHLRDACLAASAAFFWKQWGGPTPDSAGHVLDGRTWDQQPRVIGEDGRGTGNDVKG